MMSVSVANYRPIVAPDSIVSGWGSNLAPTLVVANTNPPVTLPVALGGVTLNVTDSAQTTSTVRLYMVSPGQINYLLPSNIAIGKATIVSTAGGTPSPVLVSNVAPGILTADGSGNGVPAAQILRVSASGALYEPPFVAGSTTFTPRPIDLTTSPSDGVYVILYGTGFRLHSLNPVIATVKGTQVPVTYAGAQSQYPGLDQVNIGPLPASLAGSGPVDVVVTVDGVPSNTVRLAIR